MAEQTTVCKQLGSMIKDAMRARETDNVQTLRNILAEAQAMAKKEVREVSDADVLKGIKKVAGVTAEMLQPLANAKTEAHIALRAKLEKTQVFIQSIADLLNPPAVGDDAINALIDSAVTELGEPLAMKHIKPILAKVYAQYGEATDSKHVSALIRARIG